MKIIKFMLIIQRFEDHLDLKKIKKHNERLSKKKRKPSKLSDPRSIDTPQQTAESQAISLKTKESSRIERTIRAYKFGGRKPSRKRNVG